MPSILKVIIHGARNLDAGGASTQRQPDAFVELSYGRLTRRSDVVKASRDPLWTRAAGTFKLELGDALDQRGGVCELVRQLHELCGAGHAAARCRHCRQEGV